MSNFILKKNVSLHEYSIHKYIQELEVFNIPKIIAYDIERKVLVLEKINSKNINEIYGNESQNVPKEIFKEIRNTINLLLKYNIEYSDISSYNFIQYENKLWIINFENARTITGRINPFVRKFIDGLDEWKNK
jgi:RIO-like serine/threonine protein kinase